MSISCIERYKQQYRMARPGIDVLKKEVDEYMAAFEMREEEEYKKKISMKNKIDEDGFQTIVSVKKYGTNNNTIQEFKGKRKKKNKMELDDFYRFQLRQNKREQLKSLREKFNDDKEEIKKLKRQKMLKPEE